MNVDRDPTGYVLYVNLAPEQTGPASRTEDLNDGVLVDINAAEQPIGVEVLLPRPSLTEVELRILLGCALVQARVLEDDEDDPVALQWFACVDNAACQAAQGSGRCACSGIPYVSNELWAQLAPVMKIAAALPEGTMCPPTPQWLDEQMDRLAARRANRAEVGPADILARARRGEGSAGPGSPR